MHVIRRVYIEGGKNDGAEVYGTMRGWCGITNVTRCFFKEDYLRARRDGEG